MIKEIQLGDQVWMSENLDVNQFRNGEAIPQAKTDEEWQNANDLGIPAWCYYDNEEANGINYGKLYNWYAVNDQRGLAPEGWYIPSNNEWNQLALHLNKTFPAQTADVSMRSSQGWQDGINSDGRSGFNGFPGGFRTDNGRFVDFGFGAYWWISKEKEADLPFAICVGHASNSIYSYSAGDDIAVRCIKN